MLEGARFVERRGVSSSGGGTFRREEGRVVEWRGHVSSRGGACRRGGGTFRREEGRVVEWRGHVSSRGGGMSL